MWWIDIGYAGAMRLYKLALLLLLAVHLTGCASMKPAAFDGSTPDLDPVAFFTGRTHSSGVFETRAGQPAQRITTTTLGVMKRDTLFIEQDLMPERGRQQHRSWQLRRVDAHHIDATANDIRGAAHGVLWGNAFSWRFTLMLSPGNPLCNVRMTQHMYLQEGGRTLIIRSIIRKAGIIVAAVTETFYKE